MRDVCLSLENTSQPSIATATSDAGCPSNNTSVPLVTGTSRGGAPGKRTCTSSAAHAPTSSSATRRTSTRMRIALCPAQQRARRALRRGDTLRRAHQRALREAPRQLSVSRDRPPRARVRRGASRRARDPPRHRRCHRAARAGDRRGDARGRRRDGHARGLPRLRPRAGLRLPGRRDPRARLRGARRRHRGRRDLRQRRQQVRQRQRAGDLFARRARRGHRPRVSRLCRHQRDGGAHRRGGATMGDIPGSSYLVGDEHNGFQPAPPPGDFAGARSTSSTCARRTIRPAPSRRARSSRRGSRGPARTTP